MEPRDSSQDPENQHQAGRLNQRLALTARGVCNRGCSDRTCNKAAKVGLPCNARHQEANDAVKHDQDPELPRLATTLALDHQQGSKEAEDRSGRANQSNRRDCGGQKQEAHGATHRGQQVDGQESKTSEQRLKDLPEYPQRVHVEDNVQEEALRMQERGRKHPPRFTAGKDVRISEILENEVTGECPLEDVDHHAQGDDQIRHQRPARRQGTAIRRTVCRRRTFLFVDTVNALKSDGGRPLAFGARWTPTSLAPHIGGPVRVPWANRDGGGRLSRRNSVAHLTGSARGLELFDVDALDDDVLHRTVAHARADTLDGVYYLAGVFVGNLTEDAVLSEQPVGVDRGDEEL